MVDYALLFLLGAIWGSSFLFIKIGVESMPAMTLSAGRLALAAAFMWLTARALGERLPAGWRTWGLVVVAALFGTALPFVLISWGEEVIDSGAAAILMSPMPLMTVLLAHMAADERLTRAKLAGVAFGVVGLVVLIGPQKLVGLGDNPVRELAVATAACCYAVNAIVAKRLVGQPRVALVAAMMIVGALMTAPISLLVDRPWELQPSLRSMSAVAALGLGPTALGTVLMMRIISAQGASFFAQINFLVPLFGLLFGVLLLAEQPPLSAVLALALILAGIAIARRSSV